MASPVASEHEEARSLLRDSGNVDGSWRLNFESFQVSSEHKEKPPPRAFHDCLGVKGAVAMEKDSGEDRRIYLRISTYEEPYWYVIEEKSPISSAIELPGCKSKKDRVRRLLLPEAGLSTNNVAVINSRVYLLGGDLHTGMHNPEDDESLGYRYLNLGAEKEWSTGGGILADHPHGGGVTVAHDGCVYSVGPTLYRLSPGDDKWVKMQPTPQGPNPRRRGFLYWSRLLGITKRKLYVCRIGGGVEDANVMLSFDLKSGMWDDDVLDDDFWGDWSPGVVLYEDRYLFSFGTRSPKCRPIPEEPEDNPMRVTRRVEVEEVRYREEEVPGIYVFDLQTRQWLPDPVQGLPNDGSVIPEPYKPLLKAPDSLRFSPQLFQIRKDDEHHLALVWDSVGVKKSTLTWCKFVLDVAPDTITDDAPAFYAHSLSRGTCPLDEQTGYMLNCAVGM